MFLRERAVVCCFQIAFGYACNWLWPSREPAAQLLCYQPHGNGLARGLAGM